MDTDTTINTETDSEVEIQNICKDPVVVHVNADQVDVEKHQQEKLR